MANFFANFKIPDFSNAFKLFFPKKMLGIDIGTSSIKIVELSRWGSGITLDNYGEIKSKSLYKDPFRSQEKGTYSLSNYFVSKAIKAVLDEAKIKTNAAVFSIPDFSTFCVSFELPPMSEKEINQAVYYNAPQYIPLPISETALEWKLIGGVPGDKQSSLKIFLIAIPNQVVTQYQTVAKMAGLELYAVEAEALALARSLISNNKDPICLIDIGMQSTIINIIDKGRLKKSYSFNFSGSQLTHAISSAMGLGGAEAEDIKSKHGLISEEKNVIETLYLLIDPLLLEIKKILNDFYLAEERDIMEIFLTGGTSNLSGLKEYFEGILKRKVRVPNCFSNLLYPPILEETLEDLAPSYSVSVGVALGGFET
ncbi:MAG: type IV pilus assembly protein PilM [Candidatus Staskawiczbacteria bacterium]|nr:type IV pilus assembly protein PilM [Candidatus Staskawiczbacteria bacterium]